MGELQVQCKTLSPKNGGCHRRTPEVDPLTYTRACTNDHIHTYPTQAKRQETYEPYAHKTGHENTSVSISCSERVAERLLNLSSRPESAHDTVCLPGKINHECNLLLESIVRCHGHNPATSTLHSELRAGNGAWRHLIII